MTVYYQFGTKQELLGALFDRLAERGQIGRLPEVMKGEDPLDALAGLISVFCGFWESDRVAIRRLRAWAGLRPDDAESGVLERDAWRRRAIEVVVTRIGERYGVPTERVMSDTIDVLQALTSF